MTQTSLLRPHRRRASSVGQVLLECLRTGGLGPLTSSRFAAPEQLTEVMSAARYHRLDALVADLARSDPLPEHLASTFGRVRFLQLAQHASLLADVGWLAERLGAAQVPWTLLKGVVTAARHHERPLQRSFSDLDVLVPPADFETAVGTLVAEGAHLVERNWALVRRLACGELNLVLPFGTMLDLHWSIIAEPHDRGAFQVVPEQLVDRRVPLQLDGQTAVPAPDPVDEFIHLSLHAVLGGTNSLGRWRDIALATRAGLDWDEVVRRSRAWRVTLPVAAAVDRAASLHPWDAETVTSALLRSLTPPGGWLSAMRVLGRWLPVTNAPPATRWSSHLKLTRATTAASWGYTVTELAGHAVHRWSQRPRDDWEQRQMQRADEDESARRGYFADVTAQARPGAPAGTAAGIEHAGGR